MGVLSAMTVTIGMDLSRVTSGVAQVKSDMSGMAQSVSQATAVFKQLTGAADLSRTVTNTDVASAQLTLLESKVAEARKTLQTLQNSANAGQAITGIPEAEAQLTILEGKAQNARTDLQNLQAQEEQTGFGAIQMASATSQASQATQAMGESATQASGGILSAFGSAIGSVVDFGSKIGQTYIGVKGFYDMLTSGASSLLAPAATAETTTLSFETLLHSTSAAKQEMQDLNSYAASTPLQTQWVDNAAAKIIAFGGNVGDIKPEITAIGDSLSGLGKLSDASLNSIVDIFGKISAQGKITGGDMMQLSDWGIPAWQALSTAMHKPIPELQQMVSAGLVPANVAIKALETGMESTFGGGMQKQANTFTGLMSTLASNWQIAMAAIGGPALKLAESGLSNIGTILASPAFASFATGVGQNIANVLTTIGSVVKTTVGPAFKLFMDDFVNEEPIGIFVGIFQNLGAIFMSTLSILQSLSPTFQLFVGLFKSVDVKSGLVAAVNEFISAVYIVNGITGDAANLIGSFATWLQKGGLPAQIFKDALIGIGVAMAVIKAVAIASAIADFISILPIVIGLTWMWVAGLTAAAIEMIIATWPIIAIGAAIAAVVAIIILAVQHWGDIVAWLKGAWASTVSFFQAMWAGIVAIFAGIGQWFADRWNESVAGLSAAWSKVTGFFSGVWQGIQGIFGGIGNWFHDRFSQASDGAQSGWSKATSFFGGIGQWFQDRGKDASNGLQAGWSGAVKAAQVMAQGVVNAGQWLYDHNYYVKDYIDATKAANVWLVNAWNTCVQAIVAAWTWLANGAVWIWNGVTTAIHDAVMVAVGAIVFAWNVSAAFIVSIWTTATTWLAARWQWVSQQATAIWNGIVFVVEATLYLAYTFIVSIWTTATTWLAARWTWISGYASALWAGITAVISVKVTEATTWLQTQWNKATTWLQTQWNLLAGFAALAWTAVSGVFSALWSKYISGPLGSLWNSISGWFGSFGNMALTSGQNFVQMLANGITSGAGWVWNAVVGIAKTIWTALGFHSPPAGGPLADSDTYMPNFVNMLSRGLNAGIPKMQAASFAMAQPLAVLSPASSAAVSVASTASAGGSADSGTSHTFILEVDGRQFTNQVVGPNLSKVVRLKLGAQGWTS